MDIVINSHLIISSDEIAYRTTRSSGPGGQHVNKAETQVELWFDVARSPSLSDAQRQRILRQLKSLIDQDGVLHLTAQSRDRHRALPGGAGGSVVRAQETPPDQTFGGV